MQSFDQDDVTGYVPDYNLGQNFIKIRMQLE